MSRLLFAAARGAQINRRPAGANWWVVSNFVWLGNDGYEYRIHPDDEHLQYGPISSALREMAKGKVQRPKEDAYWRMAVAYFIAEAGANFYDLQERSLFLLLLAEALADEGL